MLQQVNFYSIKNFSIGDPMKFLAEIEVNPIHEIFKGHFPGSPVVPGVCLVQITKELSEKALDKALVLIHAAQVKFLAIIDPQQIKVLHVSLELKENDGLISAISSVFSGEKVFFKFKGDFRTE